MPIETTNQRAMIKVGDQALPVQVFRLDAKPIWTDEQLENMRRRQEEWNNVFRNIGRCLDQVAEAWCKAWQPVTDTFQQVAQALSNVWSTMPSAKEHHPSKQTRHFLATIHRKEQVTPVARARKRSVRRMRAYRG